MSEQKPRVQIVETDVVKLSKPTVIVGVPEAGLVGSIAASYLVEQLNLPEIAHVESDLLPQIVVVHLSEPKYPIRVFGKGQLAVVLSDVPLAPRLSYELAMELVRWSKAKQSKMLIGITGMPAKDEESQESEKSKVLAVSNDRYALKSAGEAGAVIFEEGMLVSTYATILQQSSAIDLTDLTLLAEAYSQFPDPGAAASVIEVLNKLVPISVDIKPLLAGAEEIRVKMRELMHSTQQATQEMPMPASGVYK